MGRASTRESGEALSSCAARARSSNCKLDVDWLQMGGIPNVIRFSMWSVRRVGDGPVRISLNANGRNTGFHSYLLACRLPIFEGS